MFNNSSNNDNNNLLLLFSSVNKKNIKYEGLGESDRQESVDMDSWEIPSSCTTEEDIHDYQFDDLSEQQQQQPCQIRLLNSSSTNKDIKQVELYENSKF